jgi:putative addiction module component (TIGR02574 family)
MKPEEESVIDQALQLPKTARAALAARLLDSLDTEVDAEAEEAWAVEIERRARRTLSGESKGTDWDVIQSRVEERLRRK